MNLQDDLTLLLLFTIKQTFTWLQESFETVLVEQACVEKGYDASWVRREELSAI